jgi:flagellar hook protein FlgE
VRRVPVRTAQIGTGVRVAGVTQQFTQGNITSTTNPMDTAISGQGFFQVTDPAGAVLYSRNGQFQIDKNGFLVNNQQHKISGYMPNAAGVIITGATVPLQINPADLPPKLSTTATVGVNLNSAAPVPTTAVFNSADPTSYTNSTSLSIYDSLGASHVGNLYFQRLPIVPTSAAAAVPLGATTMTVATAVGMSVGNTVTIPGAGVAGVDLTTTITGIAGNVLTFTPATSTAVAAGVSISSNAPSSNWNSYLTLDGIGVPTVSPTTVPAATAVGATTATLASAANLAVGSTITIAGNPGPLKITGIAGTVVTFAPPTTTATAAGAAVTGVTPLTQLTFNSLGGLATTTPASAPIGTVTSAVLFPGSTTVSATQTMAFNFGSPTAGTTQYGGAFGVSTLTQDGYTSGHLNSTTTGTDGTITGRYSNGQTRPLAQLVLANFTSPQGLQPVGNNEWVQTAASGSPLVGPPGTSSLGVLQSSATEDSNVDLTSELVNMITAQRVYQANAQTIKTQDSLLQTIVSLR